MQKMISSWSGALKTPGNRENLAAVILILLIAFFIRVFALENIPGMNGDEAWIATQAKLRIMGLPYTWITPSGRIFSPIYMFIAMIFRAHDAFWIRFPSVVIGFLSLIFSYWMMRKVISHKAALFTTLILSVFPLHVMYSRWGLEMILTAFFGIPFAYFVLSKRWWPALLTILVSITSHPTFVLITPALVIPWFLELKDQGKVPSGKILLSVFFLLVGVGVLAILYTPHYVPFEIPSFNLFVTYLVCVLGVISGKYLEGSYVQPSSTFNIIVTAVFTFTIIVSLTVPFFKKLQVNEKRFFFGIAASLVLFFFVGAAIIQYPRNERMMLFACYPICLYLGLLLSHFKFGNFATFLISIAFAGSIFLNIFSPFIEHGGLSERQYQTGPVADPKRAAVMWVVNAYPRSPYFLAEDWGIYWNVLNIALSKWGGEIVMAHTDSGPGMNQTERIYTVKQIATFLKEGGIAICYVDSKLESIILQLEQEGMKFFKKGFKDYGDKEFVRIYKAI